MYSDDGKYWQIQKHQNIVKKFFNPNVYISNVLFLFHSPGSGKTGSAILASEQFVSYVKKANIKNAKVYIIGSRMSFNEFINAFTTEFGNVSNNRLPYSKPFQNIDVEYDKYLKEELRKGELIQNIYEKKRIKRTMDILSQKGYEFVTYQKFSYEYNIHNEIKDFTDDMIIIDEAHYFLNNNKYVQGFKNILRKSKNYTLLLLSATPMINSAYSIVDFLNIMYPHKKDEISYNQIFNANGDITNSGKKLITRRMTSRISYINAYNPETYPKEIEMGETPKGLLKYTKIIRCDMGKYQYKYYMEKNTGVVTSTIKNILNFVYSENGKDFYSMKLDNYLIKLARGNNDIIVKSHKYMIKKSIFGGKFLHIDNIKKYSGKYYKCIKDIISTPNSGLHFIFSKYIHGVGVKLFGEILNTNGYEEWKYQHHYDYISENSRHYDTNKFYKDGDKNFISGKYVLIHTDWPDNIRKKILRIFKSYENRYGKYIKFLLGSTIVKESVSLKNIQHVHILGYQENFPRLHQIIGRAVRYKSHDALPPHLRRVYIKKYVSSIPKKYRTKSNKWTIEEIEYQKDENAYNIIRKVERLLKMIAIDCEANKNPTTDDHKCLMKDVNFLKLYSNYYNEFLHYLYFIDDIKYEIKSEIITIFYTNIVYDIQKMISLLQKKYKYSVSIIKNVISSLIDKKYTFKNQHGTIGYLITDLYNIIFHPIIYENYKNKYAITLNNRSIFVNHRPRFNINIDNIIDKIINERNIQKYKNISDENKIKINYNTIDVNNLDRNSIKYRLNVLEHAIRLWSGRDPPDPTLAVLNHFKNFLIIESVLKKTSILYNIFDEVTSDDVIIGHIYDNIPKLLVNGKFIYDKKILDYTSYKYEGKYVGYLIKTPSNNEFILKLRVNPDEKSEKPRTINVKRGYVCTDVNDKSKIVNIYKYLYKKIKTFGKKELDKKYILSDVKKYTKNKYCLYIKKMLKTIQYYDREKIWIYED